MNILSIGNSFSQDSQRYLHRIAKADGVKLNTFNLYIGACSLSRHYRNMLSDSRDYVLEMNGESTGFAVSLKEALLNRDWDAVTVQQASKLSVSYDSYIPYAEELAAFIRKCAPHARIYVHQTWAYEENSHRLNEEMGYVGSATMLEDIKCAYAKVAADIGADAVIPSGELFGALAKCGVGGIYRDTFHAGLGVGRYALGLLWYSVLTGNSVEKNTFSDFDAEITDIQLKAVKDTVLKMCDRIG